MSGARRLRMLLGSALLGSTLSGAVIASDATPAVSSSTASSVAGVWQAATYTRRLLPVGGGEVPFTVQGRRLYEQNRQGLADGRLVDDAKYLCVPAGTPREMLSVFPFRIVESAHQVTILMEENRVFRVIRLDAQFSDPEKWDPSYSGESVGHRNGSVLTVETQNFNAKTFLDGTGLPHSEQLHISERLRTLDSGRRLEDLITIQDPMVFVRPWTTKLLYSLRSDAVVRTDWVCGQPHRDVSRILATPAKPSSDQ